LSDEDLVDLAQHAVRPFGDRTGAGAGRPAAGGGLRRGPCRRLRGAGAIVGLGGEEDQFGGVGFVHARVTRRSGISVASRPTRGIIPSPARGDIGYEKLTQGGRTNEQENEEEDNSNKKPGEPRGREREIPSGSSRVSIGHRFPVSSSCPFRSSS